MSKYNWDAVHDDIESIAMDSDGRIRGFESHAPIQTTHGWDSSYCYYDLTGLIEPFGGSWWDSLEQRPTQGDKK